MNSQKRPGRPHIPSCYRYDAALFGLLCAGALAQLGERLICIQEVRSSILLGSTRLCGWRSQGSATRAAWPLGTCLKKVQWTFLSGGAGTACGSVAQVVRAHA
jgi:hypothetical protein